MLQNTLIFNEKQTLFISSFRQISNRHHQEKSKKENINLSSLFIDRCWRAEMNLNKLNYNVNNR